MLEGVRVTEGEVVGIRKNRVFNAAYALVEFIEALHLWDLFIKQILQSINSISYRLNFTLILPYNLPVIIPMHELNQIYK